MAAGGFSSDPQAIKRKALKLEFEGGLGPVVTPVVPSPPQPAPPTQLPIARVPSEPRMELHMKQPSAAGVVASRHPTQIERLRSHSLESTGKLQISPERSFDFTAEDLVDQGEIGRGNYGTVNKMYHEQSDTVMAVKRIRSTVDEKEQKQLLMDLDVVMRSNDCNYIVQFYGALFKEGDCWICMELMAISLDKFYKFVYHHLQEPMPEYILGKVTIATLRALSYLKDKLHIIHRDVKPSNILLDLSGNIKLCDFGISGQLVDSIAKTRDAGCRPYMAPERIDPFNSTKGYDVRSDVWSLGITLLEVATGMFPYPKWNSVFDQLTQVVQGDPPRFREEDDSYSDEFKLFVNTCLIKDRDQRPKYNRLLVRGAHDLVKGLSTEQLKYAFKLLVRDYRAVTWSQQHREDLADSRNKEKLTLFADLQVKKKQPFPVQWDKSELDISDYVKRVVELMPDDRSQIEGSNS